MATPLAVGPRHPVGEDAAVEVAIDRGLDAAPQVTMRALEALVVDLEEALEMVGQGAVEHRPLGPAAPVEPEASRCERGRRLTGTCRYGEHPSVHRPTARSLPAHRAHVRVPPA